VANRLAREPARIWRRGSGDDKLDHLVSARRQLRPQAAVGYDLTFVDLRRAETMQVEVGGRAPESPPRLP